MDILGNAEHSLDDAYLGRHQTMWAKLDHVEREDEAEGGIALFDCIDSDWFTENSVSIRGWWMSPNVKPGAHVSIAAISTRFLERRQVWYKVVLGEVQASAGARTTSGLADTEVALQFQTLTSVPVARRILSLRPATRKEARALGVAGSIANYPDATEDEIKSLLSSLPPITSAGVLDVGQGNWNVLFNDSGATLLFDVGGGVATNSATFPSAFRSFCFARRPPVILSHWDWDHWSSAARFPESQDLTWIIPRQASLGPTHACFLAAIQRHGRVLVYPRGTTVTSGAIEIQQASGPRSNRNESGLAMTVRNGSQAMLFPGDAGYTNLTLPSKMTSIVVPHHGGRTYSPKSRPAASPPHPDGSLTGRVAYSYGKGNSYGHPKPGPRCTHRAWNGKVLKTADRTLREGLGHIELQWVRSQKSQPCCSKSPLPFQQL